MSLHKILLKLHLWTGLAAAAILLILGVTGSILEWAPELGPRFAIQVRPGDHAVSVAQMLESIEAVEPGARVEQVLLGRYRSDPYTFYMLGTAAKSGRHIYDVNPYTGAVLEGKPQAGSSFMLSARRLHTTLMMGKPGSLIINYATLLLVFLLLTGTILWWQRKIWKIRRGASWWRINFDLHSITGIYSVLFILIIALTGVMIHWRQIGDFLLKLSHQPVRRTAIHSRPPAAGTKSLTLEEVLARAQQKLPGARTMAVLMPSRPSDSVLIVRVRDDDAQSALKPQIFCSMDQYSGDVLAVDDPSTRPWAVRLTSAVGSIHQGFFFGWPGRIIACLGSTAVPVMVITGFLIWWRRKMAELRRSVQAQEQKWPELEVASQRTVS
jgi:uncharacterized iron-regulated membrane protein